MSLRDRGIADWNRRLVAFELNSLLSCVDREPESVFVAQEQQIVIDRVFRQRPYWTILRQGRGNARPAFAAIVGAQHVGLEVGILMVFESRVDKFVVIARAHNAAHVRIGWNAGETVG